MINHTILSKITDIMIRYTRRIKINLEPYTDNECIDMYLYLYKLNYIERIGYIYRHYKHRLYKKNTGKLHIFSWSILEIILMVIYDKFNIKCDAVVLFKTQNPSKELYQLLRQCKVDYSNKKILAIRDEIFAEIDRRIGEMERFYLEIAYTFKTANPIEIEANMARMTSPRAKEIVGKHSLYSETNRDFDEWISKFLRCTFKTASICRNSLALPVDELYGMSPWGADNWDPMIRASGNIDLYCHMIPHPKWDKSQLCTIWGGFPPGLPGLVLERHHHERLNRLRRRIAFRLVLNGGPFAIPPLLMYIKKGMTELIPLLNFILKNRFDRELDLYRLNKNVWGFPRVLEFYETNTDPLMFGTFFEMNGVKY